MNEGNGAYTVYIRLSSSLAWGSEAFLGATLPYTITGVSENDIAIIGMEMPLTGTLTLNGGMRGSGDYVLFVTGDHLTEGPERMVITLNGTTPTVSAALLINDTSTN